MNRTFLALSILLLLGNASARNANEVSSGSTDREAVAITVYNDNLALIKERRKVTLPQGITRLSLRDVSAQLRPETSLLHAIGSTPITLIEQNFDFDLLTPAKLLEKYVGHEVTVLRTHPTSGEEKREKATVLATNNGTVLRFADRIETGAPGRIVFDSVPPNLRDRPTLSILLESSGGTQSLELSYLSGGLSWKADYVASLTPDGKSMDLSGWVTLTNLSGADYRDAALQLVAGTVNRVVPSPSYRSFAAAPAPIAKAGMAQESLMDYHLYSLGRPTSIGDNQTKQLALLSAKAIPVRRDYVLTGADYYYRSRADLIGQKLKPAVFLEFDNKNGQLGKPLPAGVVRVYAKDSKGAAQFVGEDQIQHTAKNERIRLRLGEAFDITAERRQIDFKKIADNTAESSYRIELRNAKDESVTVTIQEPIYGETEIVRESEKSTKESSRVLSWKIEVPAGGKATLEYAARVRW